jgi:hypothetical protein
MADSAASCSTPSCTTPDSASANPSSAECARITDRERAATSVRGRAPTTDMLLNRAPAAMLPNTP